MICDVVGCIATTVFVAVNVITACQALCLRDAFDLGYMVKDHCYCAQNMGRLDDFIHRRVSLGEHIEDIAKPTTDRHHYSDSYELGP